MHRTFASVSACRARARACVRPAPGVTHREGRQISDTLCGTPRALVSPCWLVPLRRRRRGCAHPSRAPRDVVTLPERGQGLAQGLRGVLHVRATCAALVLSVRAAPHTDFVLMYVARSIRRIGVAPRRYCAGAAMELERSHAFGNEPGAVSTMPRMYWLAGRVARCGCFVVLPPGPCTRGQVMAWLAPWATLAVPWPGMAPLAPAYPRQCVAAFCDRVLLLAVLRPSGASVRTCRAPSRIVPTTSPLLVVSRLANKVGRTANCFPCVCGPRVSRSFWQVHVMNGNNLGGLWRALQSMDVRS